MSAQRATAHTGHGGRHRRPRVSGARGGARIAGAGPGSCLAWHTRAASRRASFRPRASTSNGSSVRACAAKALARAAGRAVPARLGACCSRSASFCVAVRPPFSAWADSSADRAALAAWLTRRPLVIHEQNAAAGLTNRLLARLARVVLQAFPGSFNSRVRAETVGNPVREDIAAVAPPGERYSSAGRVRCACWFSAAARAHWH